jgi:hypothetical protein
MKWQHTHLLLEATRMYYVLSYFALHVAIMHHHAVIIIIVASS